MGKDDMGMEKGLLEYSVEALAQYIRSVFIDRRIHREKGIPQELLDEFIARKLEKFNRMTEAMNEEEFAECMNETVNALKERSRAPKMRARDGARGRSASEILQPFGELEIKLRVISEARKCLIDLEVDRELLDKAIVEMARQCQEEIDGLTDEEFDRTVFSNVMKAKARNMRASEEEAKHTKSQEEETDAKN